MFRIFADDICFYDDRCPEEEYKLISPKLKLKDNSAGSLTFTLPPCNIAYNTIKHLSTYIYVYRDDEEIWSGRVIDEKKDFWNNRSLTCEGRLAFLNDTSQPKWTYGDVNKTLRGLLEHYISVHNSELNDWRAVNNTKMFKVGTVSSSLANKWALLVSNEPDDSDLLCTNYETTFDCIRSKIVELLGGHIWVERVYGSSIDAASNTKNLVFDGGFAGGGAWHGDYWNCIGNGDGINPFNSVIFTSNGTVLLDVASKKPSGSYIVKYRNNIAVKPNTNYAFGFSVLFSGESDRDIEPVNMYVRQYDSNGRPIKSAIGLPYGSKEPKKKSVWYRYNNSFQTDSNASYVTIELAIAHTRGKSNHFDFDSVMLFETDDVYFTVDTSKDPVVVEFDQDFPFDDTAACQYAINYMDDSETPHTSPQSIEFGNNLSDFTRDYDLTSLVTVVVPLGARLGDSDDRLTIDGGSVCADAEVIQEYGRIEKVVEWGEVKDKTTLLQLANKYLNSTQFENLVLEIKAVDLHYLNPGIESFNLLDRVKCVSKPHGLNKEFMISDIDIPIDDPASTIYTLGESERQTLSNMSASSSSSAQTNINNVSSWMSDYANSILASAIANAASLMDERSTGYITIVFDDNGNPEELYIADNKDYLQADRYWRWNINGLAYYDRNTMTEPKTAWTMDGGFVADFITSGTINADLITAGTMSADRLSIGSGSKVLNLVIDGGFKGGGAWHSEYWDLVGYENGGTIEGFSSQFFTGNDTLLLDIDSAKPSGEYKVKYIPNISVKPNTKYAFGFSVIFSGESDSSTAPVEMYVRQYNSNDQQIGETIGLPVRPFYTTEKSTWHRCNNSILTYSNTSYVRIELGITHERYYRNHFDFDNVMLFETDDEYYTIDKTKTPWVVTFKDFPFDDFASPPGGNVSITEKGIDVYQGAISIYDYLGKRNFYTDSIGRIKVRGVDLIDGDSSFSAKDGTTLSFGTNTGKTGLFLKGDNPALFVYNKDEENRKYLKLGPSSIYIYKKDGERVWVWFDIRDQILELANINKRNILMVDGSTSDSPITLSTNVFTVRNLVNTPSGQEVSLPLLEINNRSSTRLYANQFEVCNSDGVQLFWIDNRSYTTMYAYNFTVADSSGNTRILVNGGNDYESEHIDLHTGKFQIIYLGSNRFKVDNAGVWVNGSLIHSSMAELKTNIVPAKSCLDKILYSCIYNFDYKSEIKNKEDKNGEPLHYGLVIGDGYNTPKEVISEDGKGIDLYSMTSLAWKAIQEQQTIITALEKRVEELEKLVTNDISD